MNIYEKLLFTKIKPINNRLQMGREWNNRKDIKRTFVDDFIRFDLRVIAWMNVIDCEHLRSM